MNRALLGGSLLLLVACSDSPVHSGPAAPASLVIVAGDAQAAQPGNAVAVEPRVLVLDSAGAPVANEPVAFAVTGGGGSVSDDTVHTGHDGEAAVSWTLGLGTGAHRLSASVDGVASVTFDAWAGHTSADIQPFVISSPDEDERRRDTVTLRVTIGSTFALDSVTATFGARHVQLTFGSVSWTGKLPLAGEPFGPGLLVISAWDANGSRRDSAIAFFHDARPVLTITSPADSSVVSPPSLTLSAACQDDNPVGCTVTEVRLLAANGGIDTILETGTTGVTATLPLAGHTGRLLTFLFVVREETGLYPFDVRRTVYVADPARLSLVRSYQGNVRDARQDRALHAGPSGDFRLTTLAGGTVVLAPTNNLDTAALTDSGAVWSERNSQQLFQHRRGATTLVGSYTPHLGLATAGQYLAWAFAGVLTRRNLVSGATDSVDAAPSAEWDVSASGDVVYGRTEGGTYSIVRYRGGARTVMSRDNVLANFAPLTDGSLVVYRRTTRDDVNKGVIVEDGTSETEISPLVHRSAVTRGADYQVNNGWVVSTRLNPGDGSTPVWRRTPAGVISQIAPLSGETVIEALGDDGTVVFKNGGTRYLMGPAAAQPTSLGAAHGRVIWREGVFLQLIGPSVYRITP